MMITKGDAILSLRPNAEFSVSGGEVTWFDSNQTQPTEAEIQEEFERLLAEQPIKELRRVRNTKLAETDWTQNRDVTLANDADWQTYRQALRDITDTYTSLDDVVWPEKP